MVYVYIEASWFVYIGDCLDLFDDLVYALQNRILLCEESDIVWICM